jgi:Ca2+-binding RTX toxin-like protein
MHGQKGDDLYLVDDANDAAIELPREGIDSIRTTLSSFTLPANVENLTYLAKLDASKNPTPGAVNTILIGNSLPNHIVGGKGSDFIDGAGGNDLLQVVLEMMPTRLIPSTTASSNFPMLGRTSFTPTLPISPCRITSKICS